MEHQGCSTVVVYFSGGLQRLHCYMALGLIIVITLISINAAKWLKESIQCLPWNTQRQEGRRSHWLSACWVPGKHVLGLSFLLHWIPAEASEVGNIILHYR